VPPPERSTGARQKVAAQARTTSPRRDRKAVSQRQKRTPLWGCVVLIRQNRSDAELIISDKDLERVSARRPVLQSVSLNVYREQGGYTARAVDSQISGIHGALKFAAACRPLQAASHNGGREPGGSPRPPSRASLRKSCASPWTDRPSRSEETAQPRPGES
jgi:hypothetical protein